MSVTYENACLLTEEELDKIVFTTVETEQVSLTVSQRNKLFKKIKSVLGTDDYFITKAAVWELLKFMVANSPDTIEKWLSVRWLLSEIAKFSQEDYGKKISS